LRLAWGENSTLFGGMTSRGWQATGRDLYGLQRLNWTGKVPFEIKAIKIQADGFLLEFTKPVKPEALKNLSHYSVKGFTYKYHHIYGSPAINMTDCPIIMAVPGSDGKTVKLTVDKLRAGYVHEVKITGIQSVDGSTLLHDVGYYTINRIPGGKEFTGNLQMVAGTTGSEFKFSDKRITEIPAEWSGNIDQEVNISTKMGMVYDTKLIEVKAGSKVKLTLHNPDDMQHNLLIIKPGALEKVAEEALALGLEGIARNHVPNSELVLFHTRLLEPETSESIYFKVPEEPGDYQFVCTVPGHAMSMNGIFRVSKTGKLVAKQ
jgi:azurin